MSGIAGNIGWVALAKQSAKGTPATTAAAKLPFVGGNIGPAVEVDQLQETDANRQAGSSFITRNSVEGSPEVYVRDASIHTLLEMFLGTKVTTGAANFTHTITPASQLPYFTMWRDVGNVLYEQYDDVKGNELTIKAEAGQPLTATASVMGRKATPSAAELAATTGATLASGEVYNFNDVAVEIDDAATALVSSMELTIANGTSLQQTDKVVPEDVTAGLFVVSLGFDMIFADTNEYKTFVYGSTGGTVQTKTITTRKLEFLFTKGVNNSIGFTLPIMAYEEFPVEPDASGDPIVVSARARSQRVAGTDALTAIVKNQVAT